MKSAQLALEHRYRMTMNVQLATGAVFFSNLPDFLNMEGLKLRPTVVSGARISAGFAMEFGSVATWFANHAMEPVHYPTTPLTNPIQQANLAIAFDLYATLHGGTVARRCFIAIESVC